MRKHDRALHEDNQEPNSAGLLNRLDDPCVPLGLGLACLQTNAVEKLDVQPEITTQKKGHETKNTAQLRLGFLI